MKHLPILVALIPLLLASCVKDEPVQPQPERLKTAVIVDKPEGAEVGELLVKFRPEVTELLDKAQASYSDTRGGMTRSGIVDLDDVLDIISAYRIERIFPRNNRETLTRESGLHLWYLVKFDEGMDVVKAAHDLAQLGQIAKIQYSHKRTRNHREQPIALKPEQFRAIGGAATRASATFNDPYLVGQWHYINTGNPDIVDKAQSGSDVNCAEAWPVCAGDPSIIVAVMDEGVMWSHPDLRDNMWINEDEIYKSTEDNDGNGYAGDVYGYNFSMDSGVITWDDPSDTGHGTHVAGTIAAVNNNGEGVCGVAGGSGNGDGVKIMSIQTFSGDAGVSAYNEARGIKYAADNGAVILQCSWGTNSGLADPVMFPRGYASDEEWAENSPLEKEALDYFVHNAGSPNSVIDGGIVVFAAGNEYAAMAAYPGAYGDFISVSSIAADFTPASYTNYAVGVDIAAPGGDIDYHQNERGGVLSTLPPAVSGGIGYGYMEGTSMACPHVSGVAALGLSYASKLRKHFTASQYKELLLRSVKDIDSHLTGSKKYYYSWRFMGETHLRRMDLSKDYRNRMGSGIVDAGLLLANIAQENVGVKLEVPNVYVGIEASQQLDLTRFFDNASALTFTVSVEDESVATVSVEGTTVSVVGHRTGSTPYTVRASDGTEQMAYVTVRRNANDNGWF